MWALLCIPSVSSLRPTGHHFLAPSSCHATDGPPAAEAATCCISTAIFPRQLRSGNQRDPFKAHPSSRSISWSNFASVLFAE